MSRHAARCTAMASAALVVSGCGSGAATPTTSAPAPAQSADRVAYHGTRVHGAAVASDFALRDQHGRMIQLTAQRGKLVVLTFLYTRCPDVCPLIADNVQRAVRSLGRRSRDVVVLAVSVDPGGDTPSAVRRFVIEHRLSPGFHYLTGPLAELRPIWQAYNLLIEPGSSGRVAHSAYILVLDPRGRPRIYYPPLVTEPVIARDLAAMLHRRGSV